MLRDTCNLAYRQYGTDINGVTGFFYATCPYTGAAMFDTNNVQTWDYTKDVCALRQSSCVARFGSQAELPFSAFPGIAITAG
jgi:lambda family phage minor tail protein L